VNIYSPDVFIGGSSPYGSLKWAEIAVEVLPKGIKKNNYRDKYDELKKNYDGKDMDDYREAKNTFFEWLMQTQEFESIG